MIRILLTFLTLALSLQFGSAQTDVPYAIKHYSDENGLPQNSVKSIAPDKEGFLWLATESGLTRFDGKNFFVYDKTFTHALSNRIVALKKDLNTGKLYGFTEYWELIPIQNGHVLPKSASFKKIFQLPFKTAGQFDKIATELPELGIKANFKDFIIQTTANNYYAINQDTITFYQGKKMLIIPFKHNGLGAFFTLKSQLFHFDEQGNFSLFNNGNRQHLDLKGDILKEKKLHKSPLKIFWNSNTDQVFFCLNQALYEVKYTDQVLKTKLIINSFDFNDKQIVTIYYDPNYKRLFLGSLVHGLFVLQPYLFASVKEAKYPNDNNSYAQYPYQDNMVLFANGNLLRTDGKVIQLPSIKKHSDNLSLVVDQDKNIWTQNSHSIFKFSATGKLLKQYNFQAIVTRLYLDKDNILWIGTTDGIYAKHLSGSDLQPVMVKRLTGIAIQGVSYLFKQNDIIWIGTYKGLLFYNLTHKKLSYVKAMNNKIVRSLYPRHNEIWISTYGDGFYLYKDRRITKLPLDKNKYLNNAHCILEDSNGYFWISTNKGLFQVALNDLLAYSKNENNTVFYLYYDKILGFNTNEFNGGCQPCGSILRNGFFTFPSLIGPVIFNPLLIKPELPDKSIYIDKISLDNQKTEIKDTLEITQRVGKLEISISSPYFGNSNNLSFEYKFANENKWNVLNNNADITFTQLSHGTYELLIRKLNGFNSSDISYRSLFIIVSPYYYQTWWFYIIITIVFIMGTILVYKTRTRMIIKQNTMLEILINERTIDLRQSIRKLQKSQLELKEQTIFQKKLLTAITHDIKSPLEYIMHLGKRLYQRNEIDDSIKEVLNSIYLSTNRMYHFTENLLNYNKLSLQKKKAAKEHLNLLTLVTDKIDIFSEIAKNHNTDIRTNIQSDIFIDADKTIISVILHNLIDNAVKFSHSGTIDIDATVKGKMVILSIKDMGHGMPEDILNWLNRKVFKITTRGLGLKMVMEFAAKIHLKIEADSVKGQGTHIKLIFNNYRAPWHSV